MTYAIDFSVELGAVNTGLSLTATITTMAGAALASGVTGWTEYPSGSGVYWGTYSAFADGVSYRVIWLNGATLMASTTASPSDARIPVDSAAIAALTASLATLTTNLATLTTYVDTEVGAVKTQTDQLVFASGDVQARLSSGGLTALWGALTSALTGAGSIGKYLVDQLARANHTGSQAASTISDLATAILARSQHTGTQTASTISDLATVVKAYRLDEFADPNSDIPMATFKFTGLGAPSAADDSATKGYVDSVAAGLAPKDAVRGATTAAGTLASDFENGDTIDGGSVTLVTGDRILIKNQAAPAENGIYVVAASGAPTRATDADSSADLIGAAAFVSEGTINGNTLWAMTTDGPITVNTTALVFSQIAGPGSYTAGAGLTLTGTSFAITAPVSIALGGTNATTAAAALVSLGAAGRAAFNVGDNAATAYVLTHALPGGRDVVVSVHRATTPWDEIMCDVEKTSTTTVTLRFAVAPTVDQFRATIVG